MLMDKVWVVKNPTEKSEMSDICWETTPSEFAKYVFGTGSVVQFELERHSFHTSERTAKADAEMRLRVRDDLVKILADNQARLREME